MSFGETAPEHDEITFKRAPLTPSNWSFDCLAPKPKVSFSMEASAPATPKHVVDVSDEHFVSPNTAFANELDALNKPAASKSELARKSLYVAFDPMVGGCAAIYHLRIYRKLIKSINFTSNVTEKHHCYSSHL